MGLDSVANFCGNTERDTEPLCRCLNSIKQAESCLTALLIFSSKIAWGTELMLR